MVPVPGVYAPDQGRPDHTADLVLRRIEVPRREHVERAAAVAEIEPSVLRRALPAVELVLRGLEAAGGARGAVAGELREALKEYRGEAA